MKKIYDDYHEKTYNFEELLIIHEKYLTWCHDNNTKPEVLSVDDISEINIGHVAYHANL